ncbi:DUF397 domain-containing protein [Saccharopolyspora shandongensis]|uniref:DUF397 domain-containing protein n=1 Tax=Saccharopolyspora shandongensis TaxID=418495 RepID=UPI00341DEE98
MTRVINWRKSSYSQNTGDCVEVGALTAGAAVRDSKAPDDVYFVANASQWSDFVAAIKAGRFER